MNLTFKPIQAQLYQNRYLLIFAILFSVLAVMFILYVSNISGTNLAKLTRDPAATKNFPFYYGMLSYLGVLLWSAATTICFFTAYLIKQNLLFNKEFRFFIVSGFVTLLLTLDDLFMFHEEFFPDYVGIPQTVVYIIYLFIFALYLMINFKQIISTNYIILLFAFLFLGLSAGADQFLKYSTMETFYEDSLKFAGIVFWLAYFSNLSGEIIPEAAKSFDEDFPEEQIE
ncbi:MAG: hypothetical protein L3J41_17700 [Melioribacteraceae bacterium]|nr:hypothetical protein [Melioribacteraceae bacterium]